MIETDLYKILDIKKDATTDEIKKAYKKLSKVHHPDKGGDEEKFKQISLAHKILTDESKRSDYDKYGVIDDSVIMNTEKQAIDVLCLLINRLLEQAEKADERLYLKIDFIKQIKDSLKKEETEIKRRIKEADKSIKQLKEIQKRIKCLNKNNIMDNLFKTRISYHINSKNVCNKTFIINNKACEIINDYKFDKEDMTIENIFSVGSIPLLQASFVGSTSTSTNT